VKARRPTSEGWTHAGQLLVDLAEAGLVRFCVTCGRERPETSRRPTCRSTECSDPFYERFYRAWHVTMRAVRRRADVNGGRKCAVCGSEGYEERVPTKPGLRDLYGPFRTVYRPLEYDHIVEVARGGDVFDPSNIQLLCHRCHSRKTARFLALGRAVRHRQPFRVPRLERFA